MASAPDEIDDDAIDIHKRDEVQALFRRRRAMDDAEMDITPMIDITFLLLIFFLVAAKIESTTGVDLPEAKYGVPVAAKDSVIVTVASAPDGSAVVYLGDAIDPQYRVNSGDPADQRRALAEYVDKELNGSTAKHHVLIKADGALKHREVAKVLATIGGAVELEILHVAVLEK
ncbi:ExbD/TolR family protein [Lignipirellula cremea]|uniref:Colicin uptake protein TolR n=1 Tax=Lignipirellula cremea TaxID=2528010 RepID=A0A518DSB4_9BACT|nr:biopolymer transporter ExbD [Lignipirellula cremea]QDU94731.1 colicin uptake protein TolR [Lignipirellula cremea]